MFGGRQRQLVDVGWQMFVWTFCGQGLLVDDGSQGSSGDKDRRVLLVDGDRQGFTVDGGWWDAGVVGARSGVFGGRCHIGTRSAGDS